MIGHAFGMGQPSAAMTERQLHERRYASSRFDLLFMVVLTLINLGLLFGGETTYFLFSAFVPYQLAAFGYVYCGLMPEEFYGEEWADLTFYDTSLFVVLFIIAVLLVAVYALLAFLARKGQGGFLVAALVLFCIDTAAMLLLGGIGLDTIIDLALHAWVIFDIARGVVAWRKLKAMPPEAAAATVPEEPGNEA